MRKLLIAILVSGSIHACAVELPETNSMSPDQAYSPDQKSASQKIINVQDSINKLPVKVVEIPTITGVGFSAVSIQPGKNINQKRILAIKAARLDALRQLTEQVHGIQISGSTEIAEAIVQSDTLRADIRGVILGARTVKIEPSSSDTYEVIVEIDRPLIDEIVKAYK